MTAGVAFTCVDAVAADDGYGGLIAPSPNTTRSKTADEPPGYQGLIPGYVAPSVEDTENPDNAGITSATPIGEIPPSPAEAAKKYKPPKGNFFDADKVKRGFGPGKFSRPKHKIRAKSVEDIKVIKLNMGPDDEEYVADPKIFKNVKLPSYVRHQLAQRKRDENGLWDSEADTKRKIDTMAYLLNQAETPREKQEIAAQINEKLNDMREVIITQQRVPEGIQIAIGVPRDFIEQEKEAAQGSLRRIKEMKKIMRQF